MRLLMCLSAMMSVMLVACDRHDGTEEVEQSKISIVEVSAGSYETFAQFRDEVFPGNGSVHVLWLAINVDDSAGKILAFHRIIGCGEAPSAPLTILPCMGGFCMDESWPSVRGSKLNHGSISHAEMKEAIKKAVQGAEEASETSALCIFYDSDTPWEPVHEILITMVAAGVQSVTFEELPDDEHQLSEGIQRKIEQLKEKSSQ